VYSTTPGPIAAPAPLPEPERTPITDTFSGDATVATYTVAHGRDGAPQSGLFVVDLPDRSRTYARSDDADLLARAEKEELVGTTVRIATGEGGVNRVDTN
jgi:acetyl-CoA C-acetyltransferase